MTDNSTDRFTTSRLQYLSVVIAVVSLIYGIVGPTPAGLSREALVALGVFGFGIVLWQSKAIPLATTGLLVVGFMYVFGVTENFQQATVGFTSTLFFFFFTILVLGHSISKVDLDARVARRLLATSVTPHASLRQIGKYVLALSFLMPSGLARMVAFTPVIHEVSDTYGLDQNSGFSTSSFLVLGQLNPIASMSLMTGGGISLIGSQLIATAGYPLSWLEWAGYMIPPTILIFALGFFTAERFHSPSNAATQSDTDGHDEPNSMEALDRDQFVVAVVMGATLLAWAIGSFVGIPTVLPAIVAVAALSAPYIRVITANDLTEVNWGILFLIGSMLSLIEALEETGAFEWLIDGIAEIIPIGVYGSMWAVAVLIGIVVAARLLFPSGSTCLIVIMPIIISIGQLYTLNILYLALSSVLAVGSTVLLPLNIPPSLLAYNSGYVDMRDVFVFGLFTLLAALASICFAWAVYWPFLERIIY
jgi:anion transporter